VDALKTGDVVDIDFAGGKIVSGDRAFKFFPLPDSVIGIIDAGGLIEYTKKKLASK
jgi:3-isopropylmalate/(R)-2-methylmalate dehydratase small subunit